VYEIYSTQIPYTACLCSESDTMLPFNSEFKLTLQSYTSTPPFMLTGLSVTVNLIEYHTLSTYLIDWGLGLLQCPQEVRH
jgi:hypothetical protein